MAEENRELEALVRSTASGASFGITEAGFVPKPLGRLLDEKLVAAREIFGETVDLTSGSSIRKILEMIALEESRLWGQLGTAFDDLYADSATGDALTMIGAELGIPRPHHRARGTLTLSLAADLPARVPSLRLDRGTRLLTPGGHDYFLADPVTLTNAVRSVDAAIVAFRPGPEQNLDPGHEEDGDFPQRIDRLHPTHRATTGVAALEDDLGEPILELEHSEPTGGGERFWDDERYRDHLLSYPRSLWSPDAVRRTVALVPGVRQVLVKDKYGGLDINQSIFGNFNFIERLFSEERSLASPYFVTIVVALEEEAIWEGPGELEASIRSAVDEIRPIGIFPNLVPATDVSVSFSCTVAVEGVPVPAGTPDAINTSPEALALKGRILERVRRYVDSLRIHEPVRYSEVFWAVMQEPGVVDCKALRLRRFPPEVRSLDESGRDAGGWQAFECEEDVTPGPEEIAVLHEDPDLLRIV